MMYIFKEIYNEYDSKLENYSKTTWNNRIEIYFNKNSKEIIEDLCNKFNINSDDYEIFAIIGTATDLKIKPNCCNGLVLNYTCISGEKEKLFLSNKEEYYFRDNTFILKGKNAIFFLIFENSFLLNKLSLQLTV